jgi:hypothetical protein
MTEELRVAVLASRCWKMRGTQDDPARGRLLLLGYCMYVTTVKMTGGGPNKGTAM